MQRNIPAASLRAKDESDARGKANVLAIPHGAKWAHNLLEQKSGQSEQRRSNTRRMFSGSSQRAQHAPLICPASTGAA